VFGAKRIRQRRINGVEVTIVKNEFMGDTAPLHTTHKGGEIQMRNDVFERYGKKSRGGINRASIHSALIHELYHKKSFLARPSVWKRMSLFWFLLFGLEAIVAIALLFLVAAALASGSMTILAVSLLALLSSLVLMLLGVKLHLSVRREQESAADAYEAYRVGPLKVKTELEESSKAGLLGKGWEYVATHGTLAERKKFIDSLFKAE